jgi:two-component system sensor histidine kinase KdpD
VIADPALLEQVMVNLLENAVKYGAKTGEVTLSARRSGPEIAISVSDTGPGIPAEELPHIFNSFYRARREDRTVPGTGLGLAIARGLTEAMGGTIEAVSPGIQPPGANARASDGPGATVTLRLPAAP